VFGFHQGGINRVLHTIGSAIILYAIYIQSMLLVVISLLIMEYGHWYEYSHSTEHYKAQAKDVLLIQIVLIFLVLGGWFTVFHYFSW